MSNFGAAIVFGLGYGGARTLPMVLNLVIAAAAVRLWLGPPVLELSAPAQCPSTQVLRTKIAALSGELPDGAAVEATIVARDEGYASRVEITVGDTSVVRTLEAPDCELAVDALAVVAAVALDALAAGLQVPPAPAAAGPQVEPPESAEPAPTQPAEPNADDPERLDEPAPVVPVLEPERFQPVADPMPRPPPSRRPTVSLRVAAGVGIFVLPTTTAVVDLAVRVNLRRVRLDVYAQHWFSQPARLAPPNSAAGAGVELWSAGLRTSYRPSVGRFGFPVGAGVEFGDQVARGQGVQDARTQHALWAAALASAGLELAVARRVTLVLDPVLSLAFVRPSFVVTRAVEAQELYRPPLVGFRILLGVEVEFP